VLYLACTPMFKNPSNSTYTTMNLMCKKKRDNHVQNYEWIETHLKYRSDSKHCGPGPVSPTAASLVRCLPVREQPRPGPPLPTSSLVRGRRRLRATRPVPPPTSSAVSSPRMCRAAGDAIPSDSLQIQEHNSLLSPDLGGGLNLMRY
jgi:hypothetical protein